MSDEKYPHHNAVPLDLSDASVNEKNKLWSMVLVGKPDECWEWIGGKINGYGAILLRGKNLKAHRVSYAIYVGPIGKDKVICHKCDNRACTNPAHLFIGSYMDNIRDRQAKGRTSKHFGLWIKNNPDKLQLGEDHHSSKLTDELVREIFKMKSNGVRQADIARTIKISKSVVCLVLKRIAWKHVKIT